MPEAKNPKFSDTEVTFPLRERLGWLDINRFPSAVYVEHECDREHPYEEAGRTFYDRTYLRYVPERTCRRRNHDTDDYCMRCCSCSQCNAGWFEDVNDKPFSYCPHCGAKVVE